MKQMFYKEGGKSPHTPGTNVPVQLDLSEFLEPGATSDSARADGQRGTAASPDAVPPPIDGDTTIAAARAAEERITHLERGDPLILEMPAEAALLREYRERERRMKDVTVVPNPRKHPDVVVFFATPSAQPPAHEPAAGIFPLLQGDDALLLRETVRLMGVFWPEPDTLESGRLLFRAADGGEMQIAAPPSWREAWEQFVQALAARNRRLRLHVPTRRQMRAALAAPVVPLVQAPTLCHPDNPIHKATFYALARKLDDGQQEPAYEYRVGIAQTNTRQNLKFYFGLRDDARADSLISLLARLRGAAMVKVHYALWGRLYQMGGGDSNAPVSISLAQFCDDLGYAPHPKGGHRQSNKREVSDLLHLLGSIQMEVYRQAETPRKKIWRYKDRLWAMSTLEGVEYRDLRSVTEQGSDSDMWQMEAFRFRPGHWYDAPEYREQYGSIGKVSGGLMRLSATNADEWPLLIGGYLATQMRVNRYGTICLRWDTILHQTGIAQDDDALAHPARTQMRLERAMNRLCEVQVIRDWCEEGATSNTGLVLAKGQGEEPIWEDEAQAGRPKPARERSNRWRERVVRITLPDIFLPDRERLLNLANSDAHALSPKKQA